MDKFVLADLIRRAYLKHGKDSWLSVADSVLEELKQAQTNAQQTHGEICSCGSKSASILKYICPRCKKEVV